MVKDIGGFTKKTIKNCYFNSQVILSEFTSKGRYLVNERTLGLQNLCDQVASPAILDNLQAEEENAGWTYRNQEGFWQVKVTDLRRFQWEELLENERHGEYYIAVQNVFYPWPTTLKSLAPLYAVSLLVLLLIGWRLSRRLLKIYQKQEALEKERRRFADSIAHDLKTPITIISAYTQGLKEGKGTGLGLAIVKEILELHGLHYGIANTETGVAIWFGK